MNNHVIVYPKFCKMLQTNMWVFMMDTANAKVYFQDVDSKLSKGEILLFLIYNNNSYIVLVINAS